jgi:hypothetical protein
MRFRHRACLGILLLLIFFLSVGQENASGQSPQIDNAQSQLVRAFVEVQRADADGASPTQISLLVNNLNLALSYEQNATQLFSINITASNLYAIKSANLSNSTFSQALNFDGAARGQAFLNQVVAYAMAVAAGFGSALLVIEVHRLDALVLRLRLRRARLD